MQARESWLTLLVVALLPVAVALAETPSEKQAREDLEKQLNSMVATPPTKIKIELVGLDQPNYELVEASFKLDGRNLPVGNLKKLNSEGDHLIFHGDVQPGQHRLESRFEFLNRSSQVVSAEGGYKWKPGSDVSFKSEMGIEVQIKVTPELNVSGDIKQRITVKSPATVKMLAKLDDGTMPDRLPRPVIAVADGEADAGVVVVKGQTAAEKAAAAAEAKKKAREEAAAAKAAAAAEKKRLADEAKAARLAAAEEKKRAAEEAKAAKLAAAEEKKRGGTAVAVAANPEPAAIEPLVEVDAGLPEVVDAGAPVVVAVAPPPAPEPVKPPAPVEEEGGFPMPLLIGLAVAGVGLILFLLSRRKKNPPV